MTELERSEIVSRLGDRSEAALRDTPAAAAIRDVMYDERELPGPAIWEKAERYARAALAPTPSRALDVDDLARAIEFVYQQNRQSVGDGWPRQMARQLLAALSPDREGVGASQDGPATVKLLLAAFAIVVALWLLGRRQEPDDGWRDLEAVDSV